MFLIANFTKKYSINCDIVKLSVASLIRTVFHVFGCVCFRALLWFDVFLQAGINDKHLLWCLLQLITGFDYSPANKEQH